MFLCSYDIKEVLNIDNDVPVMHSLSDGEIVEMVLDNNKHEDSSNENDDIVNTGEKMPIDDMVKLCDQLIGGMEQCTFIKVHEIMAVYSKNDCFDRNLLMKRMTLFFLLFFFPSHPLPVAPVGLMEALDGQPPPISSAG